MTVPWTPDAVPASALVPANVLLGALAAAVATPPGLLLGIVVAAARRRFLRWSAGLALGSAAALAGAGPAWLTAAGVGGLLAAIAGVIGVVVADPASRIAVVRLGCGAIRWHWALSWSGRVPAGLAAVAVAVPSGAACGAATVVERVVTAGIAAFVIVRVCTLQRGGARG